MTDIFNINLRDSQGTNITAIEPQHFDLAKYHAYETNLLEKNKAFVNADSGLLVYRRFRADGVFYDKCRDYAESLALQLGALEKSMAYPADIANFLEPWYGIGYIGCCFGGKYIWHPGQAPSIAAQYQACDEILQSDVKSIHETPEGKKTLEMIEYFLDKTKGQLPMSFADVQSPLNMLSYLLPIDQLFYEVYDSPDQVKETCELISNLLIEFLKKQQELIGDCLAKPGHGFASARVFNGLGQSDDNSLMVSQEMYEEFFKPYTEKVAEPFGGLAYHSCGNWGSKIDMVKHFSNIVCADAAFGKATDPSPNDETIFSRAFDNSNIILNARCVNEDALERFKCLAKGDKKKIIAVSYCATPQQQATLYRELHAAFSDGSLR